MLDLNQQRIDLETRRTNMEQWGKFGEIAKLWQTSPSFAESATNSMLRGMNLDPKQGQGADIMNMFKNAETDELSQIGSMAYNMGLKGADPRILQRMPMSQWMDYFKSFQTAQTQNLAADVSGAVPTEGNAPVTTPVQQPSPGGNAPSQVQAPVQSDQPQAQPQIAPGARLAMLNNNPGNIKFANQPGATPGEGGFAKFESPEAGMSEVERQIGLNAGRGMTLNDHIASYNGQGENTPQYTAFVARKLGVPGTTPLASINSSKLAQAQAQFESGYQPTPAPAVQQPSQAGAGTITIGNQQIKMAPGQGGLAQRAASLYKTYLDRADLAERTGTPAGAQVAAQFRDKANSLKDNATITLSPDQAGSLGFKSGAVVQYNLASGEMKPIQGGQDQWTQIPRGLNPHFNLPKETAYQVNTNTGEMKPVEGLQVQAELAKGQAASDVKELTDIRQAAPLAQKQAHLADFMGELSQNFKGGLLAEPKILAGRVADAFGFDDLSKKLGTAEGDTLESLYGQITAGLAQKLQGRVSAKELAYLSKAGPALFKTDAGNRILTGIIKQDSQNSLDEATMAEQHVKAAGQLSNPDASGKNFYEKRQEMLNTRGTLPPDQEADLQRGMADISSNVRGVKNPISQASDDELKLLLTAGKQGKLTAGQLDLAQKRWDELHGGQ